MLTLTDSSLDYMFRCWREQSQRTRYIYLPGEDPRSALARLVESKVRDKLIDMGYTPTRTGHNDPFDLMVRGCRIEVKAATFSSQGYRFNLRGNDADLLIIGCLNSELHFFVIPFDCVRGLTYLKIPSHDPCSYMGRWTTFYEAWSVVDELVAMARNPWQMPMFELV